MVWYAPGMPRSLITAHTPWHVSIMCALPRPDYDPGGWQIRWAPRGRDDNIDAEGEELRWRWWGWGGLAVRTVCCADDPFQDEPGVCQLCNWAGGQWWNTAHERNKPSDEESEGYRRATRGVLCYGVVPPCKTRQGASSSNIVKEADFVSQLLS